MTSSNRHPEEPIIIGWREYVSLPEWGIERIKAKADTGARSSAIDVGHLEELPGDRVRFDVVVDRKDPGHLVTVEADIVRRTRVKSSFGKTRDRLFVETTLRLGSVEKTIELGLVSRKRMLCRMLIGRKSLQPDFVVDSGHMYRFGRAKRRKKSASSAPGGGAS